MRGKKPKLRLIKPDAIYNSILVSKFINYVMIDGKTPVNPSRQTSLAFRWLIDSSRKARKSNEFWKSLAKELFAAFNKEGNAYKKKEEVHRMAEANKAFAQFAAQ